MTDIFSKLISVTSTNPTKPHNILTASTITTKLGPMIVIADDKGVYLLEFFDRRNLEKNIKKLAIRTNALIVCGTNQPIELLTRELELYFNGTLQRFTTQLHLAGTPFQKSVWQKLMTIPYGKTKTYALQAQAIGNTKAHRAVANAHAANQIALVIPCHRVTASSGGLGGYAAGIIKKQWLLDHEKAGLLRQFNNSDNVEIIKSTSSNVL